MGKRNRAPPKIAFPGGNSSLNPRVSLRGGIVAALLAKTTAEMRGSPSTTLAPGELSHVRNGGGASEALLTSGAS
jgi:hypothetical protein